MKRLPTVSIITATLNPDRAIFRRMLFSMAKQTYPKRLVEHIVLDGGSDNGTVEIAKQFGCRVFSYPKLREKEQVRFAKGFLHAKGELILILESDNILPSSDWLERMVEPILSHPTVFCTYSAYNTYEQDMSALTKYCALLGSPDPTLYYLGKSDKIPVTRTQYDKGIIVSESARYWIVKFDVEDLPTLGDNGFLVRRRVLLKALRAQCEYIHVDAFAWLVAHGYDTAAVAKTAVIHVMGKNILRHVRRRVEVKRIFTDEKREIRIYHVVDWNSPRDLWNLFKYVVYSISFVQPLFLSFRGYLKIHEPAWFLHPFVCFIAVLSYTQSELGIRLTAIKLRFKEIFS